MIQKPTQRQLHVLGVLLLVVGLITGPIAPLLVQTTTTATASQTSNGISPTNDITSTTTTTTEVAAQTSTSRFFDGFEDQPADDGVPDGWSKYDDGTYTTANVTTQRASEGSQSFYVDHDGSTSSLLYFTPDEQPYDSPTVSNASADLWVDGTGGGIFQLREGTETPATVRINSAGELEYDNGTSWVTLDAGPLDSTWVTLRYYDVDPDTNTFALEWNSSAGSGTSTGLDMANNMSSGYNEVRIGVGGDGGMFADNVSFQRETRHVSGQVVACPANEPTCEGEPLANSTVEIVGVDHSAVNTSAEQTRRERAEELIEQSRDPLPSSWNPDLNFNYHQNGEYLLVHEGADWERNGYAQSPIEEQIDDPNLEVPAAAPVVLSVWDATDGQGALSNPVAESFTGTPQEQDVVVEQLSPTGETTDTTTYESEVIATTNTYGTENEHHGVVTHLPRGIYRAYPEGNEGDGYVFIVGDAQSQADMIESDLRDRAGQITESANQIEARINNSKFSRATTTTNETGHFNISYTGAHINTVAVQAYRMDGNTLVSLSDPTPSDLRDRLRATDYNGSIYLSNAQTYSNTTGLTVRALEVGSPMYGNVSDYNDWFDWVRDQIDNESYMGLAAGLQNPPDEFVREDSEEALNETRGVVNQSDQITEEEVRQIVEVQGYDININQPAPDYSDDELTAVLSALEQTIDQQSSQVDSSSETSVGQDTVDATFGFGKDFNADSVRVTAVYSNGTERVVSHESDGGYWHVNDRITTGDQAVIEQYPLDNTSPGAVQFEVTIAADDGTIGKESDRAQNPTLSGEVPDLDSISMSSLRPGPDEQVRVTANPASDSSFRELTNVTVFAPDGSILNTSAIENGNSVTYNTAGAGTHQVRLTMTDTNGNQWTEIVRMQAGDEDIPMPAGVRAHSSPLGVTALVGDGLESGDIELTNNGQSVQMVGVVGEDAEIPDEVHFYSRDVDTSTGGDVTMQVVRGEDREALDERVQVILHRSQIPDDAVVYRGDTEPMSETGTSAGTWEDTGSASIIVTHTDPDGSVTVRTNTDPSIVDRTVYELRLFGVPIPGSPLMIIHLGGFGLMAFGTVIIFKTRQEAPWR